MGGCSEGPIALGRCRGMVRPRRERAVACHPLALLLGLVCLGVGLARCGGRESASRGRINRWVQGTCRGGPAFVPSLGLGCRGRVHPGVSPAYRPVPVPILTRSGQTVRPSSSRELTMLAARAGKGGKEGPQGQSNKGPGRHPLRGEEEIDLARKMQVRVAYIRVKYMVREALGRDPTHKEWADVLGITEAALEEALTAAADAKTTMIRANMRLVMSIVRRYLSRGVQLKDLLQEGMNGLTRAAEKFDPEKGFKFSTYATWWIKQSVMRAVADQSRVVRLPVHIHDLLNQISRAERELTASLGRQPTEEEIAAKVDIPQRKLQFLRERTQHTLSMDAMRPAGGRRSSGIGDEVRVSDTIADTDPLQDVKADEAYMREQVEKLLESLNPREADVVKMRYGLIDGQQRTLEEIGLAFRVTRERVRQIEARALHKIKQPYKIHKLRDTNQHIIHHNVFSVLGEFAELSGIQDEQSPLVAAPPPRTRVGRGRRGSLDDSAKELVGVGRTRRERGGGDALGVMQDSVWTGLSLGSHNSTLISS